MTTAAAYEAQSGVFGWWREADAEARRALIAGTLGWMLDAFDVMLFALVLPAVSADLHLTRAEGGILGSIMLACRPSLNVERKNWTQSSLSTRSRSPSVARTLPAGA